MEPIAYIHNAFKSKFAVPRQSGLNSALSEVVMESSYSDPEAFRGLEVFSHIWLIWQFSENLRDGFSPTVRPPRLGGNARVGGFASRSPFRPNALGRISLTRTAFRKLRRAGPPPLRICSRSLFPTKLPLSSQRLKKPSCAPFCKTTLALPTRTTRIESTDLHMGTERSDL